MDDMRRAEAFRAEIERLKPLIKSGEPFMTMMPEALAQARGEVIHELLKRPSLSSSQIARVLCLVAGDYEDGWEHSAEAEELRVTLRALRTELNKEGDGAA